MKIYTKTGDKGETSYYGGGRASKSELRFEVIGTLDELNAHIGLLRGLDLLKNSESLKQVQLNLFEIGAETATKEEKSKAKLIPFQEEKILKLESEIDKLDAELEPLTHFVLPGGNIELGYIHIARTVCRRLERIVVTLQVREEINTEILKYINRLSDYLFVLGRWYAKETGFTETPWIPENKK